MLDGARRLLPGHRLGHPHLLQPGVAAPAEALQVVRRGGERVGHAADQVAPAVAVEIHRVFQVVGGRELDLAELARPGALHLRRRDIAAVDDAERIHQLGAEEVGAAAIVGERGERAERGKVAHVAAVIGLQPPEGDDDRAGHAVLALDAAKSVGVLLQQRAAAAQALGGDDAAGEFQKTLRERRLAAILAEDALVISEAVEGGDRAGGNALARRILLHAGEPIAKTLPAAAARIGDSRAGEADGQQGDRGHPEMQQARSHPVLPILMRSEAELPQARD